MSELKDVILSYLCKYPPAKCLLEQIGEIGKIYFIGGVLREFRDYNTIHQVRDIDIVVDTDDRVKFEKICEKYNASRNYFQGYKLVCSGLIMDVWRLDDTWAYKNNLVDFDVNCKIAQLQKTVFLNIDGIVYDLNGDKWYDDNYQDAMRSKILDVVLKDNPAVPLNVMRAMVLKNKYNMVYSESLKQIICAYIAAGGSPVELMQIQLRRYNKEILSLKKIFDEIADCSFI